MTAHKWIKFYETCHSHLKDNTGLGLGAEKKTSFVIHSLTIYY
jgi:hypothetical protein